MSENKLLRITQVNAIYLDNEIAKTFNEAIQKTFEHLPPGLLSPFDQEINLLLRLTILHHSVLTNDATFGQQLLSIKYKSLSNTKKNLYLLANCMEYIKNRLELWKPSHKLNETLLQIHFLLKIFDFINLSIFLRNGSMPLLIERLLGLEQVYAVENAQRQFETKYLARELLWNGFIEILVYVLPIVNIHKIRRIIKNFVPTNKKKSYQVTSSRTMTMHSKCAHCGENPILPHHMGCAHIFCYVCLKGNQAADSKYECPVCEHKNPNVLCDRVTV